MLRFAIRLDISHDIKSETSRWELEDGRHEQLFINYLPEEQEITLSDEILSGLLEAKRKYHISKKQEITLSDEILSGSIIHYAASDAVGNVFAGDIPVKIPPLDAVLVVFREE
jgi:hypothetical protein